MLRLLGQNTVLEAQESNLYETGFEPVSIKTAVVLERLLEALNNSQGEIGEGLGQVSHEALDAPYEEMRDHSASDRIAGLYWHETYHVGQLEILRQVSGEREAFP
jgi:hypothetical protein